MSKRSKQHEADLAGAPGMETFSTGATRSASATKVDYEGFMSPLVLEAYGRFMHFHRELEDGTLRASDNWQRGIPFDNYAKSLIRHVFSFWRWHRGYLLINETITWTLCAIIFNASGYLHEWLQADPSRLAQDEADEVEFREQRRKAIRKC